MSLLDRLERPLVGQRIVLRAPESADAVTLFEYVCSCDGLDGTWVPLHAGANRDDCRLLVEDWRAGWRGEPSVHGPAFTVTEPNDRHLVGQVGFGERGQGIIELVYGIAPNRRRRGFASEAARLVAEWLLDSGLAIEVELRIAKTHTVSQRVAEKAGFRVSGTVTTDVAATGQTYEDLRYLFAR